MFQSKTFASAIALATAVVFAGISAAAVAAPVFTNVGGSTVFTIPTAGDVLL